MLKELHKRYWETLRAFHRWYRWQRKDAHNRVGPEPAVCGAFVMDKLWVKGFHRKGVDGYHFFPRTVTDHEVVALYHQARMPQVEPPAPFDDATLQRIDELLSAVREFDG